MGIAAKHEKFYKEHAGYLNQAGSLDEVRELITYGCEGEHVYRESVHCR